MSMKPGATISPAASMTRAASAPGRSPTSRIRSPSTATSARRAGAPVPSTTVPPRTSTSSMVDPPHACRRRGGKASALRPEIERHPILAPIQDGVAVLLHGARQPRSLDGYEGDARPRHPPEAWRSVTMPERSGLGELAPDHRRTRDEGAQLAEGGLAREVLHAAVGRRDEALGGDVREPGADAPGDLRRVLHRGIPETDDAQDDRLRREVPEDAEVERRLGRLERDLRGGGAGQLRQEGVPAGPRGHRRRVPEAEMDGGRPRNARERPVDRLDPVAGGPVRPRL